MAGMRPAPSNFGAKAVPCSIWAVVPRAAKGLADMGLADWGLADMGVGLAAAVWGVRDHN